MRSFLAVLLLFLSLNSVAQDTEENAVQETDTLSPPADPHYREDQFYASVAYELMQAAPKGYSQYSFSTEVTTGFLRDFPVNKRRNKAIAIGVGYAYNNIKHNLLVAEGDPSNAYEIVSKTLFDKNKLVLHYVELPIEFRWRTSNDVSHMFWRVYAGVKFSYLFKDKAEVYYSDYSVKIKNDPNMNKWITNVYIAAGYNTWNFYAGLALNSLYKNTLAASGESLKMQPLRFGMMFYIL